MSASFHDKRACMREKRERALMLPLCRFCWPIRILVSVRRRVVTDDDNDDDDYDDDDDDEQSLMNMSTNG